MQSIVLNFQGKYTKTLSANSEKTYALVVNSAIKRLRQPCNTPKQEHHPPRPATQMPQLEALDALRERILFELKLGKQATGYKVAQKALNRFIAELTTRAQV